MVKAIYKYNGEVISRKVFIDSLIESLENDENFIENFNKILDEIYPPTDMMGVVFYASNILKEIQPVLYDETLTEFAQDRAKENLEYAELHEKELSYEEYNLTLTFEKEE